MPTPPMDGLHDISPIVSSRCVTSSVEAPALAAAAAASHPACPPPTTMTSASSEEAARLESERSEARRERRDDARRVMIAVDIVLDQRTTADVLASLLE